MTTEEATVVETVTPEVTPVEVVFDPETEKLYTTSEVATMFSVSSETVRDWIAQGKLPAIRLGSTHLRVTRTNLMKFANHKYEQASA